MPAVVRWTLVVILFLVSIGTSGDAEAKRKKKHKGPPPEGWMAVEEGQPECYNPPVWESLDLIDRKMKRSDVMDEMLGQWRGNRNDGVSFNEVMVEKVETVLLGRPEAIEQVVQDNLTHCSKGNISAWGAWASGLAKSLTAGECNTPFDYTMFDHLDIETEWQRNRLICKGNKVVLKASKDKYRITDDGPWITVEGDPAMPTSGLSDWPCHIDGCLAGILMLKFKGESGQESIYVVGRRLVFTAPEHGSIEFRINDTQFFDNKWWTSGGIVDHTSIEISPAP